MLIWDDVHGPGPRCVCVRIPPLSCSSSDLTSLHYKHVYEELLSHSWQKRSGAFTWMERRWRTYWERVAHSEIFNTQVTSILAHDRERELYKFRFVKNIWMWQEMRKWYSGPHRLTQSDCRLSPHHAEYLVANPLTGWNARLTDISRGLASTLLLFCQGSAAAICTSCMCQGIFIFSLDFS